jgi:diguanylate cyclase (GGDEF)-like protein
MAGIAIFAIAGAAQQRSEPATDAVRERSNRQASWAPFVAVAVGFGLLLFDDRHDHWLPSLTLAVGAMLLVTLVSVRQFLAQRDLLRAQGALTYQSMHDALTGLPNRALVIDRASQMLARVRRHARASATLYVDLDGFKNVNDSFGHAAGDELLRVVAQRLREGVREADTVGRIGGDEFVVLLEELEAGESAHAVAERIRTRLAEPVDLTPTAGRILSVTASVGIATGARASADELLRDADLALYEAKAAGKNRVVTFESRMQATAQGRLELELDLKEAIARDELYLLYQPIFELESETMMSVEALVRWRHPERGIVPPNHFIPAAEQSSLIVPIGRWVLETACRQVAEWHSRGYGLGVAVNVSGRQLDDDGLVEHVAGVLAETGLDPHALTLEITETALMQDAAMATRRLNELKALGVRLAIDDFGTGYSSLAYLRQFPLDTLKIDRSFVSGIDSSAECRALIRTLVQLARALGLDTLGEGIEEHSQLHHLQREECDYGQGFLFARPSEPEGIEQFLARSLSSAA